MHLLLFLPGSIKFNMPDQVDEVMCTKLLDLLWDPIGELLGLVIGYMSYRLCREDYL